MVAFGWSEIVEIKHPSALNSSQWLQLAIAIAHPE
jgi:hypothetical protein